MAPHVPHPQSATLDPMTATPYRHAISRGGGTREAISDSVPEDVVTNAVLQTELKALSSSV